MQTTREKFLAIIEERYACRAMPAGGFTIIAEEIGVTRERIRQIAKQEGVKSPRRSGGRNPKPRLACVDCGKVLGYRATKPRCRTCQKAANYLTIVCSECGIEKTIYLTLYRNNLKRGANKHGIPFCSARCSSTYWRRELPWNTTKGSKRDAEAVSSTQSSLPETTPNPIKALFSLRWRR